MTSKKDKQPLSTEAKPNVVLTWDMLLPPSMRTKRKNNLSGYNVNETKTGSPVVPAGGPGGGKKEVSVAPTGKPREGEKKVPVAPTGKPRGDEKKVSSQRPLNP